MPESKAPKGETRKLPMMPIRDMVIFPHMMTPFVVGRESSVRALEEALNGDRKIFLATQHDARIDEPTANDIYMVGTVGNIVQSVKMPDGNIKVLVEGVERGRAIDMTDVDGFFVATVRTGKVQMEMTHAVEQLAQKVTGLFEQYVKLQQSLNLESTMAALRVDEPSKLADTIAANLQLEIAEKQEILDVFDPIERLTRIAGVLDVEIEKLNMERSIQTRVKRQMERAQKEYYLNEKIKAIQKELGRGEKSEWDDLKKKIELAGMPKDVFDKAIAELKKLEAMPPMSAGRAVEEEVQGNPLHRPCGKGVERGPLWPRENQGPHPGVPGGAAAGEEPEGLDPVLCRTSGRGQNLAGHVDREGYRPQVRPHVGRRRTG